MKDNERLSYLFRHRQQRPDNEKPDKDIKGAIEGDKRVKESDK